MRHVAAGLVEVRASLAGRYGRTGIGSRRDSQRPVKSFESLFSYAWSSERGCDCAARGVEEARRD